MYDIVVVRESPVLGGHSLCKELLLQMANILFSGYQSCRFDKNALPASYLSHFPS
jgi:hypothetical protein